MKVDFYEILGVNKKCTPERIKKGIQGIMQRAPSRPGRRQRSL